MNEKYRSYLHKLKAYIIVTDKLYYRIYADDTFLELPFEDNIKVILQTMIDEKLTIKQWKDKYTYTYQYPFKKMHSREFQWLDLTNLVSYFNSFIDKQNGLNNSNDNNLNLFSGIISDN